MIRRSIHKLLAAGFAVAALTTVGAPAQAIDSGSATPTAQGWCERVPLFCENRCGQDSARCQPPPS